MTTLATFDILLRGDTRQFEQSMGHAQKTSQSFISSMASVASGFLIANVAMGAFQKGVSGLQYALIGYNAKMEQAKIGFTTLLGSAEEAEAFVKDLQHFAAVTPFEFPGLQEASTTMMAMGFNVKEIIPALTAVGDVVAAMGKSGGDASQAINRIVYNLGQMKQYGRVTGRDIRDLTMLGVPVVKILAQGFKVSTKAMQDMISKGTVPADKALKILFEGIESGNMGGMMAAQAKTFSGAMSTIKDSVGQLAGGALKPLFEAISKVVVKFSEWVSSDAAMAWTEKIALRVRAFVILLERAAPIVWEFAQNIINGMKTAVTTVQTVFQNIQNRVSSASQAFAVGGWNAIVAYAQGMMDAARTYLSTVVDYITSYVASYLIGSSPPPKGPLSKIDTGGKATIDAWVKGAMSADLSPILDIPTKIAKGLKSMESMAKYIQSNLDKLSAKLTMVDLQMARLQRTADQLQRAYENAIKPLQKQYDMIMNTYSLLDKRRDIELELKRNALQQQINAARGNWWLQEQLQAQLDVLDSQAEGNRLLEEQENLQAQLEAIPLEEKMEAMRKELEAALDPINQQLAIYQAQRDELEYQSRIWRAIADQVQNTVSAMKEAAAAAKAAKGGGGAGAKKPSLGGPAAKELPQDYPTGKMPDKGAIEKAAQTMADAFINAFANRLKDHWPTILGAVIGGLIGTLIPIPGVGTWLGATIGAAIGAFFEDDIKKFFDEGIKDLGKMFSGGDIGKSFTAEGLIKAISDMFQKAFDWIINTGIPLAADAISKFALAFITWVGPAAIELLKLLPLIASAILNFIATNGPVLVGKMIEWTYALTSWILTEALPRVLKFLPELVMAIVNYILSMVATIVQTGIRFAQGLVGAIVDQAKKLPERIAAILTSLIKSIGDFIPRMISKATELGNSVIKSFMDVVNKLPKQIGDTLSGIINTVSGWVKSGSKAFGDAAGSVGRAFGNAISNALEKGINAVIKGLNSLRLPAFQVDVPGIGKVGFPGWGGFNLGYVNLPSFAQGSWNIPKNMLAQLHQGEMVLPSDVSEKFRQLLTAPVAGVNAVTVNGPLVNIENFSGSDGDVNDLMDKMSLALRLQTR